MVGDQINWQRLCWQSVLIILHSGHTVCFWRFLTAAELSLEFRSGNLSRRKSLRFWVPPIPTVNRGSNKRPKTVLTICVDNIAPWTHCLFLTLFDSCWAKSRVSFRKRCLLSSSCNITKKRKKNVPSPSVLLHFVRDYALASFVNAVHKTKKYATKYSVLVLPDKSAFSLIFSFQHFEACTNTISKIFSWKSQKLFSHIQKTTKDGLVIMK